MKPPDAILGGLSSKKEKIYLQICITASGYESHQLLAA